MEPLLTFPDPVPTALGAALDLARGPWKEAASMHAADAVAPDDGWSGAVIDAAGDPEAAFALCRGLAKHDMAVGPVLLVLSAAQMAVLEPGDAPTPASTASTGRGSSSAPPSCSACLIAMGCRRSRFRALGRSTQ